MKKIYLLLLLSLPFLSFAQVNLTQGLKAYYPFSGNALDQSGFNNHPSYINAALTNDRFGNANSAFTFSNGDYMIIPNSSSLNSSTGLTICAWVKVKRFNNSNGFTSRIIKKGNADNLYGSYTLGIGSESDSTHAYFYGENSLVANTIYIAKDQWYFLVYVDDLSTTKLYVNNVLAYSFPFLNNNYNISDDLFFGKMNHPSYPYYFNGDLDDIRIYNRAINTSEIAALYNQTALPVTLTSFTAQKKQNDISLTWTNSNETNHAAYELQRSTTANEFTTIATVKSTGATKYDYTDMNAANIKANNVSYRLKMISKDGEVTYSKTILVPLKNIDKNIITTIYPNPFKDRLDVGVNMAVTEKISISIIDMAGKKLYNKQFTAQQGFSTISINDVEALSKGMYTLQIVTSKGSFTKQILKAD